MRFEPKESDYEEYLRLKDREDEEHERDRSDVSADCRRCGNIGCPDCAPDGNEYY